MKIVKLTSGVERRLLRARRERDLQAERVASRIVADVRRRGDVALREWSKKFDGVDLRSPLWVSQSEIEKAGNAVGKELRGAIEHAARNIRAVAEKQLPRGWALDVEPGVRISQLVRPIESIGCYIPGGRFSLMSTLLMTVIPAKVAGVRRIVVVSPEAQRAIAGCGAYFGRQARRRNWGRAGDCGAGIRDRRRLRRWTRFLGRAIAS